MSRTRRYQLLYFAAIVLLAALVIASYAVAGTTGFMVAALVLLIPGRLGGAYLGHLFRSRALVDQRRFQEGIEAGNAFLAALRRQPWRRHLVYCHYSIYTWDVEAMARNNIGAARMELGELDQAERDLRQAIHADADYAIPYFNLAVIAYVRGNGAEGDRLIGLAADRGFTGGPLDQAISRVASAYARLQGGKVG